MKAQAVIEQLQEFLPSLTNLFSDQIAITSITPSGTTATVLAAAIHGLSTGQEVNISGAVAPVAITSIERSGTVATVVTTTDHDITEEFHSTVTLSGANEVEFNGTFDLLSADDRITFTITVSDSDPASGTGSMLLEDPPTPFGYNGLFKVTVLDTTSFTYTLPQTLTVPATGSGIINKGLRLSGAVSGERAKDIYTSQAEEDDLWAFVVLNDTSVSQDRHSANDGVNSTGTGGDRRQQRLSSFSVFTIRKAVDDLSARESRDQAEDLAVFLIKSLVGKEFSSGLTGQNGTGVVYVNDGIFDYDAATYMHEFVFQQLADINTDDGVDPSTNVAFRDIPLSIIPALGTEEDALTVTVNLDDGVVDSRVTSEFNVRVDSEGNVRVVNI